MVKQKERDAGYALIPESEILERHRQHLSRMQDVAISREFINQALLQFDKLEKERTRQAHWDHYVNCDELPRPFDPAEVRTFLAKERHYEDIATDKSIDWTLSVNERSILNQNIYRADRTRRTLKQTLAINPAEYIERDVQLCLETLRKLDGLLDNDVELQRMNVKRLEDILLVRGDVEREIVSLFDRLAYRILGMQGAHMDSVDGRVATWSYKCEPWAMDIWGLLVAPVRFDQLEIPAMLAELRLTGVSVQMPLSVLKDCLTLRCIHTSFDSYSQNAKSYDTVVTESTTYPTAGIVDIQASAENEWLLQLDIQQEILDEMILKRQQYEELMELIDEKSQQAAKEAKAGNEKAAKTVVPKAPREPPLVPPGMVPDIYEEFTRREDSQYEGFLEEVYHPMTLNLTEYEINLRESIMLGGIYSIMFVGRPAQTQFEKFNIILHEDGRVLHTMPELVAVPKEPQDELRASALSAARGSRFRVTLENVENMKLNENELPYFNVVLQLAPELCLWGEPVVCQYMTGLEPMAHETSVTSLARIATEKHKKAAPKPHTHEGDQEEDIPTANIFRPSMRSSIRYSKRTSTLADKSAGLANFSLNRNFDHPQLWSLERHIIPRLLSSFKFPSEFLAELKAAFESKKKTQKIGIVRRQSIEQEEQMELPNVEFDFESQHNPERLFPVFDLVESVAYRKGAFKDSKTMHSLLDTIQGIKEKYLARQPIVEPGINVVKKSELIAEEPQPITRPPAKTKGHRHKPRAHHSRTSTSGASTTHEESMEQMEPMREVQHWTTKHIAKTTFDRAKHTLTIMTDRLGVFGLAYKRYEHFPFGDWSLQPNEEHPDEIILQLDTFHVRIYLYITAKGVRGFVTDLSKAYTAKPVKYIEIIEPVADFRYLRKIFVESNINIFAENDASFYIERDYFSIKHVAAEQHIYDVMALHCKLMKFHRSSWNPLATRRDIVLGMKTAKDHSELSEVTVRITPERASFVEVKEICSDDIDVIKLEYEETWRNISHCTDLHQAICCMNPHATEVRNKDPLLFCYVKRMLSEIRLLSFS
ncbi:uncharacterized protein LOC117580043 [Drosophila guanche]|uniref:Blast:Protein CASC1 n=1 Tax=Drosophila guanche TaxID=7266 RepID=A0A3B0J4U0_DROGU|nr:uncharacterized protein LOC117580043 [Drosophila guanche]SPP76894.1 blast:Protein CASC1 [Drosophila guanche]